MKTGKINNTGVGRLDGPIRELTERERLVQAVNLRPGSSKARRDLDLFDAHEKINEAMQDVILLRSSPHSLEKQLREARDLISKYL